MRKNNWIYVLHQTFASDLLFWIVIDNLFLSTVKGLSAFNIVLITMLGFVFTLVFYPLISYVVKKISSQSSIILGSALLCLAIILFMIGNNLILFILAQGLYSVSSPFRAVSSSMLKNNLEEKGKEGEYIKWQGYGKLGYSIITLVISLIAGPLFNVWAYLPCVLCLVGAIVSLILSCIYTESKRETNIESSNQSTMSLVKNKLMVLILLVNLLAVGVYTFMQSKATLLIQYVCQDVGVSIAKISILISIVIFGSRLMRVIADMIYPKIYSKTKNKSKIIIAVGVVVFLSNLFLAIGANINAHHIIKLIFICIGLYLILFIRDIYLMSETKIITNEIPKQLQKQAFVLANVYFLLGRLFANLFGLILLGFVSINTTYIFMLILTGLACVVCFPLSKYFKK